MWEILWNKDEKILSRLRTGSVKFLKQHFYDVDNEREYCVSCGINMTIKHMLIVCPQFAQSRQEIVNYIYGNDDFDLDEKSILGEKFDHKLLFEYLKKIDFYKKI